MKNETFRKIYLSAAILTALVSAGCGLNVESGQAKAEENPRTEIQKAAPENQKNVLVEAAAKQIAETRFRGSISDSKFEMTLQRDGDKLSGSYFYLKSGAANSLKLNGKIDENGRFTIQESDATGKQTGEFSGTWKNDQNDPGALLEGEWKKPKAGEATPFYAAEQIISDAVQINTKNVNETNNTKRFNVNAEYPEIVGTANAAGFNALAKKAALDPIAGFKKDMLAQTAEDLKYLPEGMNNFMEISYRLTFADEQFVSVNFINSIFTGGAHPNHHYFTVNYDLKNGRELKLADLFKPSAKYLEKVAEYSKADLQSRADESGESLGLATDMWAEGVAPTAENYNSWNLTKKGLMFTFDPYQVGPYAAGSQTVIVPYNKLKDLARADGALAKWMK